MNQNPFDFGYVFSTADYVWGPYSTIFFIVFLIGAIISNLVFFVFKYRFKNNLLTYTLVNRASRNAAIAFSLGVFFFLSRIALLQPFNARVFLDLSALLLLYYIIRGIIYMFRTYPKAKAEWQARQARENRKNEPRTAAAAAAPARPVASTKANGAATTTAAATPVKAAPAKVATTAGTVAAADTNVISPASEAARQGLSERGQKRRERKRSKR
jgi:hypothetical protein